MRISHIKKDRNGNAMQGFITILIPISIVIAAYIGVVLGRYIIGPGTGEIIGFFVGIFFFPGPILLLLLAKFFREFEIRDIVKEHGEIGAAERYESMAEQLDTEKNSDWNLKIDNYKAALKVYKKLGRYEDVDRVKRLVKHLEEEGSGEHRREMEIIKRKVEQEWERKKRKEMYEKTHCAWCGEELGERYYEGLWGERYCSRKCLEESR